MANSVNESEAEYDGSGEWHWWMAVMSSLDGGGSGGWCQLCDLPKIPLTGKKDNEKIDGVTVKGPVNSKWTTTGTISVISGLLGRNLQFRDNQKDDLFTLEPDAPALNSAYLATIFNTYLLLRSLPQCHILNP
ncbi:hypothetical protein Tco_0232341 [Tanacetum coccineum]